MQNKNTGLSDGFFQSCAGILSGTVNVGIILLLTVFPLILHDSYFDILETKYQCYYVLALGTLGVLLILTLIMMFIDQKEYGGAHTKKCLTALKPENWKTTFCAADAAVMVFWLACAVSTLLSDYRYESFWGNEGRYSGLFLISIYVAMYFAVSRLARPREWQIWLFLASGMLVALFGITDYFKMDIMGFCAELGMGQDMAFTSTMGNINTFTAYVGLVAGAAAGFFCAQKKRPGKFCAFICMLTAFSAAIMGRSDNTYLSIAGILLILPFAVFRTQEGIRDYVAVLASFFTVLKVNGWIAKTFGDRVIEQGTLFTAIMRIPGLWLASLLLWVLALILEFRIRRSPGLGQKENRLPVIIWAVFLTAVFLVFAAVFYDANLPGHAERYGSAGGFLVFDDDWGTYRGYIWNRSWRLFRSLPLRHRLFGYGPDTFGILTHKTIRSEMINVTGRIYDNAHNEYLQYLLTLGWAGLFAYVAFLIFSAVRLVRNHAESPVAVAVLCAVAGYAVQAVVNLNLPISAPMFWLLLSLGAAELRVRNGEQK